MLGRWKNWDASLGQHWAAVQEGLHQAHPVAQPKVPDEAAVQSFTATANSEERRTMEGAEAAGERMLGREEEEEELLEDDDDEDDDDDDDEHTTFDVKPVATAVSRREHELAIMRKVMRKWWRLAGLPGHPRLCDELGESEFAVHRTKVRELIPCFFSAALRVDHSVRAGRDWLSLLFLLVPFPSSCPLSLLWERRTV